MIDRKNVRIHPTAEVSDLAQIGAGTSIWNQCQVREDVVIGTGCIFGKDVYVDFGVQIGDNVKVQNGALLYHGVTVESGVFIGPGAILTNDKRPRAVNLDGSLKSDEDWEVGAITVCYGAAIGAGAVVLPDVRVGRFALVGAGAVVTGDVPDHGLVYGNPARLAGFVCGCGQLLEAAGDIKAGRDREVSFRCPTCESDILIAASDYALLSERGT